jgi:hypothetical protein
MENANIFRESGTENSKPIVRTIRAHVCVVLLATICASRKPPFWAVKRPAHP